MNFGEIANTQSLTERAILRIDNAIELLSKKQPIILREDKVVAKFLRNAIRNFQVLKKMESQSES